MYQFKCDNCDNEWEELLDVKDRNLPTTFPCDRCNTYNVYRVVGCGGFNVTEGACGNAANGYSSYVGDEQIFKAKSGAEKDAIKKEYGLK